MESEVRSDMHCVECGSFVRVWEVHLCRGSDPVCPFCAHMDVALGEECEECGATNEEL